jgi:hypothetical protein
LILIEKGLFICLYFISVSFGYLRSSLSLEKVQRLFTALNELVEYPADEKINPYISRRQIDRLIRLLHESKNKRLSREQFINMKNTKWTDDDNGAGSLLAEHTC